MKKLDPYLFLLRESWIAALRALRANKTRTMLATTGVIMGVATVCTMLAIIQGLNKAFATQFNMLGIGTLYIQKWPWVVMDDWWVFMNRKEIKYENYQFLRDNSELAEAVTGMTGFTNSVKGRGITLSGVTIFGVDEKYLDTRGGEMESGRFFTAEDVTNARNFAVIGQDVADEIYGMFDPIGREIKIGNIPFTVVGLLTKQGKSFGQSLDKLVIIPYFCATKFTRRHPDITIIAKAYDAGGMDELESEVLGLMRVTRRLKPQQDNDFSINRQNALDQFYKSVTGGVYMAGILIAGISLLVGGIGIMNIMLVSVTERTNEIGMRKALGAKRGYILTQFLMESAVLCAIGGVIGLALSFGIAELIKNSLPATVPVWLAIGSIVFSAFIGILFGLYPAARASRLNPIEALRYEG
ncbi:MAG: ABC transporter permease [bacterium]|nr:ABC transporter permease [bacterium]